MGLKVVQKKNFKIFNRLTTIHDFERCITYAAPCKYQAFEIGGKFQFPKIQFST